MCAQDTTTAATHHAYPLQHLSFKTSLSRECERCVVIAPELVNVTADDAARSVTSSSLQWPQLSSSSVTVDLSHASSSS
ncbi:hypothetical protein Bca4012_101127 [Brassica carinata]